MVFSGGRQAVRRKPDDRPPADQFGFAGSRAVALPADDHEGGHGHLLPGTAPVAEESPVSLPPRKEGGTARGEDMMKASLVSAINQTDRPQRGNLLNRLVKQAIIGRLGSLQYGSPL